MSKVLKKGRVTLDRALSKRGLASRAEARDLIVSGRVKVHGVIEKDPGKQVNPDTAHIEIDGKRAERDVSRVILFHKPKGVVTTKRDPEGRKTVFDFFPDSLQSFHAVGRLDMHTTGLLLLTNDTRLSSFLTDPESGIRRVYLVGVRGGMESSALLKMREGILDKGELLRAVSVEILKGSGKESLLEITLTEGKNREIRRLCLALGHEVISLKRIRYGDYSLGNLGPGEWIEVEKL